MTDFYFSLLREPHEGNGGIGTPKLYKKYEVLETEEVERLANSSYKKECPVYLYKITKVCTLGSETGPTTVHINRKEA